MSDDNNIFQLVSNTNSAKEDSLPQFHYVITDIDFNVIEVYGFPVFSPQYLMIMQEIGDGQTVPAYMTPLIFVRSFELDNDIEDAEKDYPV